MRHFLVIQYTLGCRATKLLLLDCLNVRYKLIVPAGGKNLDNNDDDDKIRKLDQQREDSKSVWFQSNLRFLANRHN